MWWLSAFSVPVPLLLWLGGVHVLLLFHLVPTSAQQHHSGATPGEFRTSDATRRSVQHRNASSARPSSTCSLPCASTSRRCALCALAACCAVPRALPLPSATDSSARLPPAGVRSMYVAVYVCRSVKTVPGALPPDVLGHPCHAMTTTVSCHIIMHAP